MPDALYTELEKMNAINQTAPSEPTFLPSFPFGNFDWCSRRGWRLGRISCTVPCYTLPPLFLPLHPRSIGNGVLYFQSARYRLSTNNPSHFQKGKEDTFVFFLPIINLIFIIVFCFLLFLIDFAGSRRAPILTMLQKARLFAMRNSPNQ